MKLTDSIGGFMTLEELWEALAKLSTRVVEDNTTYVDKQYPIDVRSLQLRSLDAIVDAIKQHHTYREL